MKLDQRAFSEATLKRKLIEISYQVYPTYEMTFEIEMNLLQEKTLKKGKCGTYS